MSSSFQFLVVFDGTSAFVVHESDYSKEDGDVLSSHQSMTAADEACDAANEEIMD